jgi:hypothetical protein
VLRFCEYDNGRLYYIKGGKFRVQLDGNVFIHKGYVP